MSEGDVMFLLGTVAGCGVGFLLALYAFIKSDADEK